jgi:hypothetical protein
MPFDMVQVLELTSSNYTIWKCNMIDVLRGKNLWWIVNGDIKKPVDAKDVAIWEECYEHARGFIGQIIYDRLQVYIESEYDPIEVWKIIASMYEKIDDVSTYYLENKIHELHPKDFERIEQFLVECNTHVSLSL